jgi:bifunctional non-homologous end joining protein LigD
LLFEDVNHGYGKQDAPQCFPQKKFMTGRTKKNKQDIFPEIQAGAKAGKLSQASDDAWETVQPKLITSQEAVEVEGHSILLTNIEKELWKGMTKAQVITYYNTIAPFILPYLKDRPLGLNISPEGPFRESVFIRGLRGHYPKWAKIYHTERKHKKAGKSDTIDWLICNDLSTLVYMINLNCIDLHPWSSRIITPDHPDYISIDLDPSDNDFGKVIETARAAKELLDQHRIKSFIKTSGKSGMHIFLPSSTVQFGEARIIAENICNAIHDLVPGITTTERSVTNRGNKLYVDPSQNDYSDRLAAAYCVRAYKQPTVSTPLEWKEVSSTLHPSKFTLSTILKRLEKKGDLWKNLLSEKVRTGNIKGMNTFR